MAAVIRGTPNFIVPPSQNTAPVDEFRCLYTHDIRKKQKKWHDGTVKFHTFNRRVMVYDDARNYVGDLHYRVDEHFGEGVELQLDRGVMVEVGEPLGQTQTDVTALVNRGHAKDSTAAAATSAATQTIRRINAADPQGRPKSLAEVLGASQGRHGRARLPVQSPFEQRRSLDEMHAEQPPTKKQKFVSAPGERLVVQPSSSTRDLIGKENISVQPQASPKKQVVTAKTTTTRLQAPNSRSVAESITRPAQPPTTQRVVDISSEEIDEDEAEQTRNRGDGRKGAKQRVSASTSNSAKPAQSTSIKQKPVQRRSSKDGPVYSSSKAQAEPYTAAPDRSEDSRPNSKRGSATLRFAASSKPRPKLLYKALLPSSAVQESTGSVSRTLPDEPDHKRYGQVLPSSSGAAIEDNSAKKDTPPENNLDDMDIDSPDLPSIQSSSAQERLVDKLPNHEPLAQHSPLFVSQAESHRLSSSPPSQVPENDSFGISFTQELCSLVASNVPQAPIQRSPISKASTPRTDSSTSSVSPTSTTPPVLAEKSPRREPVIATANVTPQTTLPLARMSNIPPPTSARPFRRVVSENDSTTLLNNLTSATTSPANLLPIIETPLRPGPLLPAPEISPILSRRRSPLKQPSIQRSFSDTQAIVPQPLEIETADTTLKQTDEQGPWTKLEAFLLFETWPDSKKANKPVFERIDNADGDHDGDDVDGFDSLVSSKPSMLNNFRSARMVLQDEQ